MIFKDSRYASAGTLEVEDPRRPGETVRVVRPRIATAKEPVRLHELRASERLDHVAYAFYGDASATWRILDGAEAIFPEELEVAGEIIPLAPVTKR